MVRTGGRASALTRLLEVGGSTVDAMKRQAPRLDDLEASTGEEVLALYKELGGLLDRPALRPGAWDLSMDGVLIELDEELHFNRYRRMTLTTSWAADLPWTAPYLKASETHELECLRAATWGQRWSSTSSARMFGRAAPPGELAEPGGAPRWKQRALYDAMKDAAARERGVRVARLSVFDEVSGVLLGAVLNGRRSCEVKDLMDLLASRTAD